MARVGIVGDSSVACIKEAVDAFGELSHSVIFFAAPGTQMSRVEIQGPKLIGRERILTKSLKQTSGGRSELDCSELDVLVLCGLGLDFRPISNESYSKAVFTEAVHDIISKSISYRIQRQIRAALPSLRIVCIPAPYKALPSELFGSQYPETCFPESSTIRLITEKLDEMSIEFMEQPLDTKAQDWLTDQKFCRGSKRLLSESEHPENDFNHMNIDYGRVILKELANKI